MYMHNRMTRSESWYHWDCWRQPQWLLLMALLSTNFGVRAQTTGSIRLTGSFSGSSQGRLEIYYNLRWGTVCDNSFGSTDANVACKELGYNSASTYGRTSVYGYSTSSSTQPIWLDNVACSSSDTLLRNCGNRGIGVHDCTHSEDIVLYCSNTVTSTTSFNLSGIIIGVTIASIVVFIVVPVIICIVVAVCVGGCAAGVSSRRVNRFPTQTQVLIPTPNTAQVTMTTTAAEYNQQPNAYPLQKTSAAEAPPQYQVGGYPAYPPQGQPGGYPPQGQPGGYPPQGQLGGYPPQDQADGYPPQDQAGGYPPQEQAGGYPPQDQPGGYPNMGYPPPGN